MSILLTREAFILPRAAAPDVEIFAIGDIHGRSDLFAALLDQAAREPRQRARRTLVLLGDLIDRGPDSLGVIDLAGAAGERIGAEDVVGLMGNHEALMRLAIDPSTAPEDALDAFDTWTSNGGDRLLAELANLRAAPAAPLGSLSAIRAAVPPRVAQWLQGLRAFWRSNEILFVHAGVNPRFELEAFLAAPWNTPLRLMDEERHWAWVRWPFLDHDPGPQGWNGFFVVHGHTPNDGKAYAAHAAQIGQCRLNLDAGSGHSGVVEMAIIRGDRADVVAARGPTNETLGG